MNRFLMRHADGAGLLAHLVLELLRVLAVLDQQPPPLERVPHLDQQFLSFDRFDQVAVGAGRQCPNRLGRVSLGGQHDDGRVGQRLRDLIQQIESRAAGHRDVEGRQVDPVLLQMRPGGGRTASGRAGISFVSQPA